MADQEEQATYAELRAQVSSLLDEGRHPAALRQFLVGIGMPRPFTYLLRFTPDWRPMVALAPTLTYDMALTAEPPPVELASTFAAPMHVAVGGKSPRALHRVANQLVEALPGERPVTVVEGQDHMVSAKAIVPLLNELFEAEVSPPR
ncbi:hypothetical protein ACQCX2_10035 [Propionibacteriaceae bacterium Y1700]|uniref:hypothetical protein n=1 Tax=Microlunatus sp. Y1700 TaxID=3418487 RepID=UPI003DA78FA3